MYDEKPQTPWWRKKRWWAVFAFWLALPPLYVLSSGPALYGSYAGWWPPRTVGFVYAPLTRAASGEDAFARWYNAYLVRWAFRGIMRAAEDGTLPQTGPRSASQR